MLLNFVQEVEPGVMQSFEDAAAPQVVTAMRQVRPWRDRKFPCTTSRHCRSLRATPPYAVPHQLYPRAAPTHPQRTAALLPARWLAGWLLHSHRHSHAPDTFTNR